MSKIKTSWKDVKDYLKDHELTREQRIDLLNLFNKQINAFPIDEVVQIATNGLIIANGKVLTLEQREAFIIASKSILSNPAFNLILEQVRYQSIKKGLHDATNIDEIYFSKVALYFTDLFMKYLQKLDNLA